MSYSSKGFHIPEYGNEADIPLLFRENVEVLERLLDKMDTVNKDIDGGTLSTLSDGSVIDGGEIQ